jgi:hypothetical protein
MSGQVQRSSLTYNASEILHDGIGLRLQALLPSMTT